MMNEIQETELRIVGHEAALIKYIERLENSVTEEDTYSQRSVLRCRGAKHWKFAIICCQYRLDIDKATLKQLQDTGESVQLYLSTLESIERKLLSFRKKKMARDFVSIGCTPAGENCESLGPNYDPIKAKQECVAFMRQLRRVFGEEPQGARLRIKSNPHDFGSYLEVICEYDENNEVASDYAFECENLPESWDTQAKIELGL